MTAAVLYGKEHLQIESVPVPKIEDGDVLVRVQTALTCGTDVKVFRRGYHARMIVPPALFGHELAGDIVNVGKDVRKFRIGQRVVAANSAPCLECFYCRRGSPNLCEDLLFNNGAYAEYIRIPARIVKRNMYEIPAQVSYQDAALIEPLACVMRGLEETQIRPGDHVAIIGLGPIGLMFVRLAKIYGARVIAIGRRPTQLERAARMGAEELLNTSTDPDVVAAVRDLTKGRGVDVAIEAVGVPATFLVCEDIVGPGGTIANIGVHGAKVDLHLERLWSANITITTRLVDTVSTPMLLKAVRSGKIDPKALITHRFKAVDFLQAYETFGHAAQTQALKVIIEF